MATEMLFRITLPPSEKITTSLNDRNFPKALRDEYEERGYLLSNDEHISIRVKKENKVWELYDEIQGYYHRIDIKLIGGKLTIYDIQKEEPPSFVSQKDKQEKESDVDIQRRGNLKICSKCGAVTNIDEEKCPYCGEKLELQEKSGLDKQREQERTRKSNPSFEINRIKVLGKGKNILPSLALFIIPSILIWLGLDILGMPSFIILIALILTMGIIAIIVGIYSGLSSKSMYSGLISGFVAVFMGSLIVILLISSIMGMSTDQETEETIELNWGGVMGSGEIVVFIIVMGMTGGISAILGNSITSNVIVSENQVCSNCGKEHLNSTNKCPNCGRNPVKKKRDEVSTVIEEKEYV